MSGQKIAADYIRELTQPHTTMTLIDRDNATHKEVHKVTEAPLLQQLAHAVHGSTSLSDDDATQGTTGSKPAAHLEAVDTLARINEQARDLAADNGLSPVGTLTSVLHRLSGAIGNKPHHRVHSWWAAARMVTHHDLPPHRPYGIPCPVCSETNTLRIRFDEELAACVHCGATWDRTGETHSASLDMLGQWVKWCSDHEIRKARHWTVDDDGYPVECTVCLNEREAIAERKHVHQDRRNRVA